MGRPSQISLPPLDMLAHTFQSGPSEYHSTCTDPEPSVACAQS
jgi:hypothetical protein